MIGKMREDPGPEEPVDKKPKIERRKIMVIVANDCMGHGDDESGEKLMLSFLKTLKEMGKELWRLVFVNNGVKLTIEGSEVLPVIQKLDKEEVRFPLPLYL